MIDGLDGSGKATQTQLLAEALLKRGTAAEKLSFPRYEKEGSALVRAYLAGKFGAHPDDVNCYAASSFYAADRYISFITEWREGYSAGGLYLSDRYTTSNAIFQTPKLSRGEWDGYIEWLEDYEYVKLGIPKPDLVVFLDMSAECSASLMEKRYGGDESRKDIHERDMGYQRRCREAALWCAAKCGWLTIPCDREGKPRAVGDISAEILNAAECII